MKDAKIALVTGANKGIGYETARQLGEAGVTVLVGARDVGRGEEAVAKLGAEGFAADLVAIDVTDPDSVAAAAALVDSRYGRLDILVNNAGVARDTALPSQLPLSAVRETFETNVFGPITVTNAMLPLLRRSRAGRIVNVSSTLGSLTLAADPLSRNYEVILLAYNSSKSALNMATVTYAKELRDTPIKVNAVNPGYCATDLNGNSGVLTAAQGAAVPVRLALVDADGPTGGFFQEDGPVSW